MTKEEWEQIQKEFEAFKIIPLKEKLDLIKAHYKTVTLRSFEDKSDNGQIKWQFGASNYNPDDPEDEDEDWFCYEEKNVDWAIYQGYQSTLKYKVRNENLLGKV